MDLIIITKAIRVVIIRLLREENFREFINKLSNAKSLEDVKDILGETFNDIREAVLNEFGQESSSNENLDQNNAQIDSSSSAILEPSTQFGSALSQEVLYNMFTEEGWTDQFVNAQSPGELDDLVTEIQASIESRFIPMGTLIPESNDIDTTTKERIISEIVDIVSDDITLSEIHNILNKIIDNDLDANDIIRALNEEIEVGRQFSPSESFEPQDLDNCGVALPNVIARQFGIHVPEGVLTLRALLNGRLDFDIIDGKVVIEGTRLMHSGQVLESLGIEVGYDYNSNLDIIRHQISLGRKVIVGVDVEHLWKSGDVGRHVIQILQVNEALNEDGKVNTQESTVTVNDTGIGDEGNAIEYSLDDFLKAWNRTIMFTEQAPSEWTPPDNVDGSTDVQYSSTEETYRVSQHLESMLRDIGDIVDVSELYMQQNNVDSGTNNSSIADTMEKNAEQNGSTLSSKTEGTDDNLPEVDPSKPIEQSDIGSTDRDVELNDGGDSTADIV